jgi:sterol desaturase/sphingolipid hydroxylase (fatty acid hydroxylase superfamily)
MIDLALLFIILFRASLVAASMAVAVEIGFGYWRRKPLYRWLDTAADLSSPVVQYLILSQFAFLGLSGLSEIYSHFHLFQLSRSYLILAATIVATDFVWYWFHRGMHSFRPLWPIHATHHSTTHLNFIAFFRSNWLMPPLNFLAMVPLALLGFPPDFVVFAVFVGMVYQLFCHTTLIRRFRFLDGWMHQPSDHRIHHAMNAGVASHNFSAIWTIWDRIFRTYLSEYEEHTFGLRWSTPTRNPLFLSFRPIVDYLRGRLNY